MRILLVDDDALFLRCIERRLESRGIGVVSARTAREALALATAPEAAGDAFDAILCDLHMPDMNGAEFYERLQAADPVHAERVAFASGALCNASDEAFAAKHEVLIKPFPIDTLIGVARRSGRFPSA